MNFAYVSVAVASSLVRLLGISKRPRRTGISFISINRVTPGACGYQRCCWKPRDLRYLFARAEPPTNTRRPCLSNGAKKTKTNRRWTQINADKTKPRMDENARE